MKMHTNKKVKGTKMVPGTFKTVAARSASVGLLQGQGNTTTSSTLATRHSQDLRMQN
jgi:hypothetical protein